MKHYEVQSQTGKLPLLVFDWDEEAGTVSGPGAWEIEYTAKQGYVCTHPYPTCIDLTAEPLKSKRDMALILSCSYILPPDLAKHMPDLSTKPLPPGYLEPTY